jgi:hypothetical protein
MKSLRRIALFLFFLSINFEVWDPLNTNGLFSIAKLMGYIYLATMLPRFFYFLTNKNNSTFIAPLFLYFAILTIVNLFNSDATLSTFFNMTIFQNIFLLYILINHEQEDPLIIEKGLLGFALGSGILAILYNAGIGIEISENGQVSIFHDNQNSIGFRSCVASIILIHNVVINPLKLGYSKFLLLLPLPLIFELLAVSASRSAVFSLILALVVGGSLVKTGKIWGKYLVILSTICFLIVIASLLMQHEVFRMRLMYTLQEGDTSGREIIWRNILPLIRDNPLFGVGTVGYETYSIMVFGELKSPHNVFLEILSYTGILGLSIYIVFLYRIVAKSFKMYTKMNLVLPMLLLIPVFVSIASMQILNVKTGWIIFAYIAGSYNMIPEREQNADDLSNGIFNN